MVVIDDVDSSALTAIASVDEDDIRRDERERDGSKWRLNSTLEDMLAVSVSGCLGGSSRRLSCCCCCC